MATISNKQFLKHTKNISKQLKDAKRKSVNVGLPSETIGSKIYEDGQTVLDVGIKHEYGIGVPRRSFLNLPFLVKDKEVKEFIYDIFKKVIEKDLDVTKGLGLVGINSRNIVIDAFSTGGFGRWKALSLETINDKGSSAILTDTGTLKNSITWVVK